MQENNAQQLLDKFKNGKCSDEELAIIESWYNQSNVSSQAKLTDEEWAEDVLAIYQNLEAITVNSRSIRKLWYRLAAAASVIVVLAWGAHFLFTPVKQPAITQILRNDVLPGGNKATLVLSNGKQVVLTNAKRGRIATEPNSKINKTADGQISYMDAENNTTAAVAYNTLTTPLGGQYELILSDGTRVMLNAASSIRYPTKFSGKERTVTLTGEAYFEVAHNADMPFHVLSKLQDVRVLGTHFNINSYDDEPDTKTTLLEGSVIINEKTKLKPGQQAIALGTVIHVADADTELAVAWKNNKFMFDNSDIESIMRMVARWYNVSVVYAGPVPRGLFGGSVSRFKNVSELLNILEMTGKVHFKIEGRRITVTK